MIRTENESFFCEAKDTIDRIYRENRDLKELYWFYDTALRRFDCDYLRRRKPDLIVLGNDIPAELIYAVCDEPFYVLGGSLETAHWADELTPRDTDPFSRSSLGWLVNPEFDLTENALIVTAISSDNRRKLVSLLQNSGRDVAALDIPPAGRTYNTSSYYKEQLISIAQTISKYTGKRLTGRNLRRSIMDTEAAHKARQKFLSVAYLSRDRISDEAILLALQCMYFTDSLREWTDHMNRLSIKLEESGASDDPEEKAGERPEVLILGSPVVFPNYKVPGLISSSGMKVAAVADSLSLEADLKVSRICRSFDRQIDAIAETHLGTTSSGARIHNRGLHSYYMHLVRRYRPEGIVCHVLKGQIEYDFELPYIEQAAEEAGIPVFRLETDYQYQDVEQLRIRMEAFGELLMQRKTVKQKNSKPA